MSKVFWPFIKLFIIKFPFQKSKVLLCSSIDSWDIFSNFLQFCKFFYKIFFFIKRWSSKIIDSEVLPQPTHLKMTKSQKSLKIVPLWWKNQTCLVKLEPQAIWNSMVVYRTTELRFLELLLNPNYSWLLWGIWSSFW